LSLFRNLKGDSRIPVFQKNDPALPEPERFQYMPHCRIVFMRIHTKMTVCASDSPANRFLPGSAIFSRSDPMYDTIRTVTLPFTVIDHIIGRLRMIPVPVRKYPGQYIVMKDTIQLMFLNIILQYL
jgi:hypothetical protein